MSELDDIRRRKLEELQASQQREAELTQQVAQLEAVTKERLTKEALTRLGNIRAVDPEKALQITVLLAQLIQSRRVRMIDDEMLKHLLTQIQPKKEFRIIRK